MVILPRSHSLLQATFLQVTTLTTKSDGFLSRTLKFDLLHKHRWQVVLSEHPKACRGKQFPQSPGEGREKGWSEVFFKASNWGREISKKR